MELLDKHKEYTLGVFRIVVGLLFTCHGAATLFDVWGGPHGGQPPNFGAWPNWWAAAIQLIGGALVLLGLSTRSVALICSGSMAYAYFFEHQSGGLFPIENGGESAAMFCWAFLLVVFFGPGRWSFDALFERAEARAGNGLAEPTDVRHQHSPTSV